MRKAFETQIAGFNIELWHDRADFKVVYGKQVSDGLSYVEAARELGLSIMHALSCDAKLDNG